MRLAPGGIEECSDAGRVVLTLKSMRSTASSRSPAGRATGIEHYPYVTAEYRRLRRAAMGGSVWCVPAVGDLTGRSRPSGRCLACEALTETPSRAPVGPLRQIGEVVATVGLSLRTVRFYEEAGLVIPVARTAGGFRLYDDESIARLRLIMQMKPLGFTLDEMRLLIEAYDDVGAGASRSARPCRAPRPPGHVRRRRRGQGHRARDHARHRPGLRGDAASRQPGERSSTACSPPDLTLPARPSS